MIAPPPGLRRKRRAARLVLLFEQAWPAFWPALGMAGAWVCVAWFGLLAVVPPLLHLALLALVAAGFAVLLLRGARRLARPSADAVDRRLERAGGVAHRPLAVLADRPAAGAAEDPVWQAHLARVRRELRRLRVGWPHPGLAARDRRALRGLLAVSLVASFGVAGPDAGLRLAQAFRPGFVMPPPPPPLQIEAWVTPPGFTGQAPVALATDRPQMSVPAGSRVSVSLSGGSGEVPHLSWDHVDQQFHPLDASSFQAGAELTRDGTLAITRDGRTVAHWQMAVVADVAPTVAWAQPPGEQRRSRRGGGVPQTRLPWEVAHPYGVVALQAEFHLRERPQAPVLSVEVPLPGRAPKTAHGARIVDLTANPWAGLPVAATLVARAAGGLVGHSAEADFVLPERPFQHPVARAIVAVRKQLALHPEDRAAALAALDRIAADDPTWADDPGGFLTLRAAQGMLQHDPAAAAIDAVQASLWELALRVEEGSSQRSAQTLAQARRELRQALNPTAPGKKPDPAEVERRSQAVARALQKHLQALAQDERRDPSSHPQQDLDKAQRDAQAALQKLRDAAAHDQMDAARDRLAELDQALDALQPRGQRRRHAAAARPRPAAPRRPSAGQRHVTALQDIVRREGGLLDHAQHRASPPDDLPGSLSFPPGQTEPDAARNTPPLLAERATDRRVAAGAAAGAGRADAAIRRPHRPGAAETG